MSTTRCFHDFSILSYRTLMCVLGIALGAQADVPQCSDVAPFSATGNITLMDRAVLWGGVRALGSLSMGYDAKVYSHIAITGDLTMNDRSVVSDWAYVGGSAQIAQFAIMDKGVTNQIPADCGSSNSAPAWSTSTVFGGDTLTPGSWGTVLVPYGRRVFVKPGNYQFGNLVLQSDARLVFVGGDSVNIDIREGLSFGDRVATVGEGESDSSLAKRLKWSVYGSASVQIGYDAILHGALNVPNSSVYFMDRSVLYGSLTAASATIGYDAKWYAIGHQYENRTQPVYGGNVDHPLDQIEDWNPFLLGGLIKGNVPKSGGPELTALGAWAGKVIENGPSGGNHLLPQKPLPVRNGSSFDLHVANFAKQTPHWSSSKRAVHNLGASTAMGDDALTFYPKSPAEHSSIGTGEWVQGVNSLSGRYSRSIPLANIVSQASGLGYPVTLSYLSPPPSAYLENVTRTPTSSVGYGWTLEFPFVVAMNGGTVDLSDDTYYLNLGQWGSGQLMSDGAGSFYLSTNPNCRVTAMGIETKGIITRWIVELPDSTVLLFGGDRNAIRYSLQNGLRVATQGSVWKEKDVEATYPYRWDIVKVTRRGDEGALKFDWEQKMARISSGTASYTLESWPKAVWLVGSNSGIVVDSIAFYWGAKSKAEVFADRYLRGLEKDPRLNIESKYLDSIEVYSGGVLNRTVALRYKIVNQVIDGQDNVRRHLTRVEARDRGVSYDSAGWNMGYDTLVSGWLNKIVGPDWVKDSIHIARLPLSRSDSSERALVLNAHSHALQVPWVRARAYRDEWSDSRSLYRTEKQIFINGISDVNPFCNGDLCYVISRISDQPISDKIISSYDPFGNEWPDYEKTEPPTPGPRSLLKVFQILGAGMRVVFEQPLSLKAEVTPGDGFFVVHDSTNKRVRVYNWNGASFDISNPFEGDGRRSNKKPVEVAIGAADYFLVKFANDHSREIVPVMKDRMGIWRSINRDYNNCEIDARKNSRGVNYYVSSSNIDKFFKDKPILLDGCIELQEGVDDHETMMRAEQGFFVLIQKANGIHLVFNRVGGTFVNFTDKLLNTDRGIDPKFDAGEPWDSDWFVYGLVSGNDFFAASYYGAAGSGEVSTRNVIWRWDGTKWNDSRINSERPTLSKDRLATLQAIPNGLTHVSYPGSMYRYQMKPDVSRIGEANAELCGITDKEKFHSPRVSVSQHYSAISFYGPAKEGRYSRDYPEFSTDHYNSIFFSGTKDLSPYIKDFFRARWGLFDIEVSPDESWMIGKHAFRNGNRSQACHQPVGTEEVLSCTIEYYLVPLSRNMSEANRYGVAEPSKWIRLATSTINGNVPYAPKMSVGGMSVMAFGDAVNSYVRFSPMTSRGPMWNDSVMVDSIDGLAVASVTRISLHKDMTRDRKVSTTTRFNYGRGDTLAYNGLIRAPESRRTVITQEGEFGEALGKRIHTYWVQRLHPGFAAWVPDSSYKVGHLESDSVFSIEGKLSIVRPEFRKIRRYEWRETFQLSADTSKLIVDKDQNGVFQTKQVLFGRYDLVSLLPQVRLTLLPDESVAWNGGELDYLHDVEVQIYNDRGQLYEKLLMRYKHREFAAKLLDPIRVPSILERIDRDIESAEAIAISGVRINYLSNNFDVKEKWIWGNAAHATDVVSLSSGIVVSPMSFLTGWIKVDSIGLRTENGRVLQTVSVADPSNPRSAMSFIEGVRGQVTASLTPAWPEDVAVLTAEDGQVGLNNNTWTGGSVRGKWIIPTGVTYDATHSHLGRYSMKVVDSYGPTVNLYLRDRADLSGGLEISAWVYTDGASLQLNSQLRLSPTAEMSGGWNAYAPKDGVLKPKTWQRWVLRISYDQLRTAGALNSLETGSAELRIFCGPGPEGASGKTIWVDNFVVRPVSSSLSLVSHDHQGRVMGMMDGDGHWSTTEYDSRGRVQAVRDERGRVVNQGSLYPAGEN